MNSPHSTQQFENYYFMIPIYFAISTLQSVSYTHLTLPTT